MRVVLMQVPFRDRCAVLWVDAHGDFNTPESTISGFFAGISLATLKDIVTAATGDRWATIRQSPSPRRS